jgi:hypothetical protein
MTTTIPGRRINNGETFYTDWIARGGDCAILRAQLLVAASAEGALRTSLETRSEEETSTNTMDTYYPASAPKLLELVGVGFGTAIYLATTGTNSPLRGFKEQVRAKVTTNSEAAGDYWVVRLFPVIFFDNSIE